MAETESVAAAVSLSPSCAPADEASASAAPLDVDDVPAAAEIQTGTSPASASASGAKKRQRGEAGGDAQAPSEGQGDAKRRRADFAIGDSGVFFTTVSPGGCGTARRDLVRLLEEAFPSNGASNHSTAEEGSPAVGNGSVASVGTGCGAATSNVAGSSAAAHSVASTSSTAASRLEAELRHLRETPQRFVTVGRDETCPKGTGFVKFAGDALSMKPSEVVVQMLDSQKAEFIATRSAPCSRLLCRVFPIDYTCKPFLDDFKRLAEDVLPKHIGAEAEPTVWALEFRARNTSTLKKEAVLQVIDGIVAKGRHRVNISDPEKCILVEVNPLFCGLSVLPRWADLKKYNLNALTSPPEASKKSDAKKLAAPRVASDATKAAAASPPASSPPAGSAVPVVEAAAKPDAQGAKRLDVDKREAKCVAVEQAARLPANGTTVTEDVPRPPAIGAVVSGEVPRPPAADAVVREEVPKLLVADAVVTA